MSEHDLPYSKREQEKHTHAPMTTDEWYELLRLIKKWACDRIETLEVHDNDVFLFVNSLLTAEREEVKP